jgi:hypothetical protein
MYETKARQKNLSFVRSFCRNKCMGQSTVFCIVILSQQIYCTKAQEKIRSFVLLFLAQVFLMNKFVAKTFLDFDRIRYKTIGVISY